MKVLRSSLFLFSILLLLAAAAIGQKDNRVGALPADASLDDTESWLVRAITSNSAYATTAQQGTKNAIGTSTGKATIYINSSIKDLKFNGCQVSYTMLRSSKTEDKGPTVTTTGPVSGGMVPMAAGNDDTKVNFDLKDINTDEITVHNVDEKGLDAVLSMRTIDYKRTIKLKSQDSGAINVSVVNMVLSPNVSDQVRDAFTHAVTLCQAPKT
jgi:hypothetical protein